MCAWPVGRKELLTDNGSPEFELGPVYTPGVVAIIG